MTRNGFLPRACLAAASCAASALLVAGCGGSGRSGTPTAAPTGTTAPVGRVHAEANGSDVTVTDVTVRLDPSGGGNLVMTVHNAGSVTDHLDMVGTPGGGRGTFAGGAAKGSGAMTTAGIQLLPDTTTRFSGQGGPAVHLGHVTGVTSGRTLPLVMQFGVAGLVRVQAHVTGG